MPSNAPEGLTPAEALARIAAHCDELETDAHPGRLIAQVRAVLAEVRPVAGAVLTPEDIPRVVYALRNQDHTSEADWQLAARLEAAQ